MEKVKEIKDVKELVKMMHQLKDDERLSIDIEIIPATKKEKNHE